MTNRVEASEVNQSTRRIILCCEEGSIIEILRDEHLSFTDFDSFVRKRFQLEDYPIAYYSGSQGL